MYHLAIGRASPPEMVARLTGEHASPGVDATPLSTIQNTAVILLQSRDLSDDVLRATNQQPRHSVKYYTHHHRHNRFTALFSGTTRVSRCQKRTSGLYGARED